MKLINIAIMVLVLSMGLVQAEILRTNNPKSTVDTLILNYNSQKNINIITPIGTVLDTQKSPSIANHIVKTLNQGILPLNDGKLNICGAKTHILSIGINNYAHTKLHYAASDAKKVPFSIQKSCPNSNIHILLDEAANKNAITATLDHLLESAKKDDTVIIYFSGYGTELNGKKSIIPVDAKIMDRDNITHITLDDIAKMFEASKATVYVLADTCFTKLNSTR